ncbi:hypothetical protein V3C99_004617, partial [Haemonchus contortus]
IQDVRLGRYENRNPFFLMALPKIMQNSAIHEELLTKSMQLMTHFDIHATLNDILHYQPHSKYSDTTERRMLPISKGSSLLRKWQGPRNCQTLPIPFDYCICQYEKKNVTNELLRRVLGFFVADELNRTLERMGCAEKCLKQEYKRAIEIEELQVGVNTLYTVYVELQPSNGLFSDGATFRRKEVPPTFVRVLQNPKQGHRRQVSIFDFEWQRSFRHRRDYSWIQALQDGECTVVRATVFPVQRRHYAIAKTNHNNSHTFVLLLYETLFCEPLSLSVLSNYLISATITSMMNEKWK